jgi:hypothetical protein
MADVAQTAYLKGQFGIFDFNKFDVNEITQYMLYDTLFKNGVDGLLPPEAQGSPPEYSIYSIDTTKEKTNLSTSELMNLFISKKYDLDLLQVNNKDLASLISYIKLQRVPFKKGKLLYGGAYNFIFDSYYNKNSLVQTLEDRGNTCGITSLKIDVHSNSGAYYTYAVNLSLYFQNASTLINNPQYKNLLSSPASDEGGTNEVVYVLSVGWARPLTSDGTQRINNLYEENLGLVLNVVRYSLGFNMDGSVTLNLDLKGGAETTTNSLDADVLVHKYTFQQDIQDFQNTINNANKELEALEKSWTDKKQALEAQKNQLANEAGSSTDDAVKKQKQEQIQKIEAEVSATQESTAAARATATKLAEGYASLGLGDGAKAAVSDEVARQANDKIANGDLDSNTYFLRKESLENRIKEANAQIDQIKYTSIMKRMFCRMGVCNGTLSFTSGQRVILKPRFIVPYQVVAARNPESKDVPLGQYDWGVPKNLIQRFQKLGRTNKLGIDKLTDAQTRFIEQFTQVYKVSGQNLANAAAGIGPTTNNIPYGEITFTYFFLGDLISVLTENMYSNMSDGQNDFSPMETNKVILGTVDVFKNDKKYTFDLANIPIAYNTFTTWYMKKVVNTEMKVYPFDQFLKDFLNDCVLDSFYQMGTWYEKFKKFTGGEEYSLKKTYADRTVELSYTDLPVSDINGGKLKITPSEAVSQFGTPGQAFVLKDYNVELYKYLFIYCQSSYVSKNCTPTENMPSGIFHFYVGATTGILKDIKFQPINNEKRFAAQVLNAAGSHDGKPINDKFNVIARYDVNISCIGFHYFKPGQIIYVDTSLLGFGKSNQPNSVARQYTLGGYYLITKVNHDFSGNDFTTNIVAKFESYGT